MRKPLKAGNICCVFQIWEIISINKGTKKSEVRKAIEEKKYKIESASLQFVAKDLVPIDEKVASEVIKILEALDEHDDVQNVYSNADFPKS